MINNQINQIKFNNNNKKLLIVFIIKMDKFKKNNLKKFYFN